MPDEKDVMEEGEGWNKPSSARRYLLLIAGVLLIQAAAAYFLMTSVISPRIESGKVADDEGRDIGSVYIVEDVIVNPAETGGTRFLSVTLGLEMERDDMLDGLKRREPQIRDILIDILASKTIGQLSGIESRGKLRKEILSRINGILIDGKLVNVYFVNFVLQ